jgi:hypothetical protein
MKKFGLMMKEFFDQMFVKFFKQSPTVLKVHWQLQEKVVGD